MRYSRVEGLIEDCRYNGMFWNKYCLKIVLVSNGFIPFAGFAKDITKEKVFVIGKFSSK